VSELANRMGVEADFARRLSRLTSRQRRELREMLGNPPDIRNVSEADWNRWEEERRRELALILLAIILAALNQHAEELLPAGQQPSDETRTQAYRQALLRAQAIAADSARSSIQSAKEIVIASGELIRTGTAADIEGVLASALGPDRDAVTAATTTTLAQTEGTNATQLLLAAFSLNLVTRWQTEKDGKVCPICRPLHGKSVDLWDVVLQNLPGPGGGRAVDEIIRNGGPPAHPNCRCYLQTKAEPTAIRNRVL